MALLPYTIHKKKLLLSYLLFLIMKEQEITEKKKLKGIQLKTIKGFIYLYTTYKWLLELTVNRYDWSKKKKKISRIMSLSEY